LSLVWIQPGLGLGFRVRVWVIRVRVRFSVRVRRLASGIGIGCTGVGCKGVWLMHMVRVKVKKGLPIRRTTQASTVIGLHFV
jgi:hypothetical protein